MGNLDLFNIERDNTSVLILGGVYIKWHKGHIDLVLLEYRKQEKKIFFFVSFFKYCLVSSHHLLENYSVNAIYGQS